MPSPGLEPPRPYATAVSVTNQYTGWVTVMGVSIERKRSFIRPQGVLWNQSQGCHVRPGHIRHGHMDLTQFSNDPVSSNR
ncbi:hypothetical protein TNCV_2943661 [Trichonephila clavipes]|nr:hypothetical protein TNCV_2943661 [Trichonephila clavipes]